MKKGIFVASSHESAGSIFMVIIDGKQIADQWLERLRKSAPLRVPPLGLAAILIGADDGLKSFVKLKKRAAEKVGVQFSLYEFDANISETKVLETMQWLAKEPETNGILVELPLPKSFHTQTILDAIPLAKDVDVLSNQAQVAYYENRPSVLPPAVAALKELVSFAGIKIAGKRVAVFGQGMLVGKPIAHWCQVQGAQVDRIDEFTKNPEEISLQADIIISGVGKPDLITADMVKDDAIVIDYGYGHKDGAIVGDVDFSSVSKKAELITPVPGGMGPLVVVAVLENLIKLSNL